MLLEKLVFKKIIAEILAPYITTLNISNNNLLFIPTEIKSLKRLEYLFALNNEITNSILHKLLK